MDPPFFKEKYLNKCYKIKLVIYIIEKIIKKAFQCKKPIENLIYVHLETGIFHGMGIPMIPARWEIHEAQEVPGNSRTGNSREGKV